MRMRSRNTTRHGREAFEDLKAKTDKPFFDMKGELDRELAAKFDEAEN